MVPCLAGKTGAAEDFLGMRGVIQTLCKAWLSLSKLVVPLPVPFRPSSLFFLALSGRPSRCFLLHVALLVGVRVAAPRYPALSLPVAGFQWVACACFPDARRNSPSSQHVSKI